MTTTLFSLWIIAVLTVSLIATAPAQPGWGKRRSVHPFAPSIPTYQVTDLGAFHPTSINSKDEVVGWMDVVGDKDSTGHNFHIDHACLWLRGKLHDLGVIPLPPGYPRDYVQSRATAITDGGVIVGSVGSFGPLSMSGLTDCFPFIYRGGKMRLLDPSLYSSDAAAINDHYQVAGGGNYRAFIWSRGKLNTLKTLSRLPQGNRAGATGLNDRGQVVGWSTVNRRIGDYYLSHAFLWRPGELRDLGTLPGYNSSSATGINGRSQVVGVSRLERYRDYSPVSQRAHAFLWKRGRMIDLGALKSWGSRAEAINNAGIIVGAVWNSSADQPVRALIWFERPGPTDLNVFIPRSSGWLLRNAAAINAQGKIVGTGILRGKEHAFLLTPQ